MSTKERLAAYKAAKAEAVARGEVTIPSPFDVVTAAGGSSSVPRGTLSRAQRFATVGFDDDERDPDEMPPKKQSTPPQDLPRVAEPDPMKTAAVSTPVAAPAPVPAPAAPAARTAPDRVTSAEQVERVRTAQKNRKAKAEEPTQVQEVEEILSEEVPVQGWDDPRRPAGSDYSEEEWLQAEVAHPGHAIMEVVKPHERALVAKLNDAFGGVLHRSMVIDRRVNSPWKAHATVQIEHHGEFGVTPYDVVRSATQVALAPWAEGSKMVMRDAGHEEEAKQERGSSRAERFRG
jgi:hypothetical protein